MHSFSYPIYKNVNETSFIFLQPLCFHSCSDATDAQTPFPPADSVASLRRCGLGVLLVRRMREEGEVWEALTSGPPAYHVLGKELANRFYNGTLHAVTQHHKPVSFPNTSTSLFPVYMWWTQVRHNHMTANKEMHSLKNHNCSNMSGQCTL